MALPYDDFDPPVGELVRALNDLPGIETSTSCGGHEEPISADSLPPDQWMVGFELKAWDSGALVAVPTREAWVSLEWLAWLINDETDYAAAAKRNPELAEFAAQVVDRPYRPGVTLRPWSRPPYLYYPGRNLRFAIEGHRGEDGMEPNDLAELIRRVEDECYIPAAETWTYEERPDA